MTRPDEPGHMWSYWRDKKGCEEALRDYYPAALAADPELQMALYQISAAHALIESKMGGKEYENQDE